jgi:hypothetical protein
MTTIAVELTRQVDGPEVLAALQARGVTGKLERGGCAVIVEAEDGDQVARLVDEWAAEHGLPFVPVRVDGSSYALVPPAG